MPQPLTSRALARMSSDMIFWNPHVLTDNQALPHLPCSGKLLTQWLYYQDANICSQPAELGHPGHAHSGRDGYGGRANVYGPGPDGICPHGEWGMSTLR